MARLLRVPQLSSTARKGLSVGCPAGGSVTLHVIAACLIALCTPSLFSTLRVQAQEDKSKRSSYKHVEPHFYAPDLYADSLRSKFTLINLPGSEKAGSYWEVSYQIYFIAEEAYEKTMRNLASGGVVQSDPEPSLFSQKILLDEGSFKLTNLNSLNSRTRVIGPFAFKSKIPDAQRTKAAYLMTSYTAKIYDASLKNVVYDSGVWMTKPFETDQQERPIPRTMLFANFFVSPTGQLFKSQWTRQGNDTNW